MCILLPDTFSSKSLNSFTANKNERRGLLTISPAYQPHLTCSNDNEPHKVILSYGLIRIHMLCDIYRTHREVTTLDASVNLGLISFPQFVYSFRPCF